MKKIVIVGAGTAGLAAAAMMKSYWGSKVDITLIYDKSRGNISVGESTTPIFRLLLKHLGVSTKQLIKDTPVDVCFIGSCTNGRISDLRVAAKILKDKKVSNKVKAFVVPGSEKVANEAKQEGLDQIFKDSGFQWREPGCSMCLAMNSDKLIGNQVSASSSNRNFKGRQGSPNGRTLLMSPAMVAAAAINGKVSDVREFIN